jgi:hypothetical protein
MQLQLSVTFCVYTVQPEHIERAGTPVFPFVVVYDRGNGV